MGTEQLVTDQMVDRVVEEADAIGVDISRSKAKLLIAAALSVSGLPEVVAALQITRAFLVKPEWGTARYMEGSEIYGDKDAAVYAIDTALASIGSKP
jgi:hypothetical protein